MFTTFSVIQQSIITPLMSKNSGHKMENGYWQRWVLETTWNKFFCIVSTKNIKSCCSPKKINECVIWLTYHLKYFLIELPLMLYSLIPQSSIEILSMEFRIWFGGKIPYPQLIPASEVFTQQICLKESLVNRKVYSDS